MTLSRGAGGRDRGCGGEAPASGVARDRWCSGGVGDGDGGAVGVGGDGPAEGAQFVEFAPGEAVGVLAAVEVVAAKLVPVGVVGEDVPAADEDAVADGLAGS